MPVKIPNNLPAIELLKKDYTSCARLVLGATIDQKQFEHDLKMLTYIPINLLPFPESFGDVLKNRRV